MARVQLKQLTKRWGNTTAVEPLSLDIADGEFVVLLGPSGCGKTTTMRIVAGLEEASAGEVWIGERCVNALEPKDRDVAMVFQSYGLYPNMTVAQNIGFPLKIRGMPPAQLEAAVLKAAERVELTELLQRRPKELSGGQRQRVALARAIVRQPAVFLMDEPLSNLDAKLRVSMRAHIKHLHHSLGVTTVYVTHDQVEAMTLADRVVVMSRARVQQVGTPQQIYETPANLFVAGFIGSPPMNLVHGHLHDGTFVAPGVTVTGLPLRAAGPVVLGLRPEDLVVDEVPAEVASKTDADAAITTNAATAQSGVCVRGTVFTFELLGDSTGVTLQAGPHKIMAKAGKAWRAQLGQALTLRAPTSACHLFDATAGNRL